VVVNILDAGMEMAVLPIGLFLRFLGVIVAMLFLFLGMLFLFLSMLFSTNLDMITV
jgi:hypothetical protein